jgi:transposase
MTSLEDRYAIKKMVEQGLSSPQIAKQLGLKVRTVRKWRHRVKKGATFTLAWAGLKKPLSVHLIYGS